MLQLLSPAGNTEAVIAAVQSGADMVYMGFGESEVGRNAQGFSSSELSSCLRYCRVRGCGAAVSIGELTTDDSIDLAIERAVYAVEQGADALLIQDLGLVSVLRRALPDTPLWGSVRLDIHNIDGALTAAAMGLSRVTLAPELSKEQISAIAKAVPIETAVCVHGPLCFAHIGQCYMSAFGDSRMSDSALQCTEPCRGHFSLGGRMDECPMSMSDTCLINHLEELEEDGVSCAVIGGRKRRPEYVAHVTQLYRRAIKDNVLPTKDEIARLEELFAPYGLTDAYYTGIAGPAMLRQAQTPPRNAERGYAEIRKGYMNGELRRVPVTFYVVIQQGKPAMFAAEDARGHRAVYEGYAPIDLGRQGITAAHVEEVFFRTGGTPYNCVGVNCIIDPHMDYADETLEQARRALLSQITDKARSPVPATIADIPEKPESRMRADTPQFIVQISRADQLSSALADTAPDRLYVPAELLAAGLPSLGDFLDKGSSVTAVLPRIISDEEKPVLRELLATLRSLSITEVLAGNISHIPSILEAGMIPRGDFGLNITNSRAAERLSQIGLASITASFQLSARQIRRMASAADTEMIVYGRVPVMITEQCLIRNSAGRCSCSTPSSMSDRFGDVYPVEKDFGCRNTVYDRKKIFLADKPDIYENIGLWGIRLMFTTESARECADVANRYRGRNHYQPNNTSRGLYAKGAL